MRVAYLGGAYIPSREANAVHQMRMAQALAGLGHEVTLHILRGSPPVEDDFVHYGVRPTFRIVKHDRPQIRGYGALLNARSVWRHYRTNPLPDLFYAREPYGLAAVVPRGVPFVFESHWKPKHVVQQELERWFFGRPSFKRVVLISRALRDIYEGVFPHLSSEQMVVAHDAADPVPHGRGDAARNGPLRVAYVGGMLPGYGVDVVLEIAKRRPDLEVHIVGGKEDQIAFWRAHASRASNARFHGFVPPGTLGALYADFDVVLAPYQAETAHIRWISPMKLFEYMAHGKAIVCSDFPVMREILDDGVHALLVAPRAIDDWVAALDRLKDARLRSELGARARERLESEFTWKRRAERVLEGVVAADSPSRRDQVRTS